MTMTSNDAIAVAVERDSHAEPAPSQVSGDRRAPLLTATQHSSEVVDQSSWLQRLATVLGVASEETTRCPVCFDAVPASHSVTLSACGHRFCRLCMTTFLQVNIRDGQVYPKCFHEVQDDVAPTKSRLCRAIIDPLDIEALVSEAYRSKYHTFRFNKENELGRQCPHCGHSQLCEGPKNPACVCVNCGDAFCFLHASAHKDRSCEQYEREQLDRDRETRTTIARISRECPNCKIKIEKDGGCNHLKCSYCSTNFCWMCGAVVDNTDLPSHFQWWNLRGCAGLMRADIHQDTLWQRIVAKVLSLLNFVIIGPASFALTVVLTVVTLGCLPCVCFADMSFGTAFLLGMELCSWFLLLPLTVLHLLYGKIKQCYRRRRRDKLPAEPQAELDPTEAV